MLFSVALILLIGMIASFFCKRLRLPSLVGMIVTGILLGPYCFNYIDESILNISTEIREIALVVILMRAGFSLDVRDLKKVGRPAVLMSFLPAVFEIGAMIIFAPLIFGLSRIEAAIMGAVVGAVSPAVIVPSMIKLLDKGYGKKKSIPQLILAGASVDDIFVIVIFTTFMGLAQGKSISFFSFVNIPISIVLGSGIGFILGYIIAKFFEKFQMRDTQKVLIILSMAFILVTIENKMTSLITFSALIAIMFMGISLQKFTKEVSNRMYIKFNKLWVCAEIFLFVLIGASVDISYAANSIGVSALLIFIVLAFRLFGVFLSLLGTNLSNKERLFCGFGYIPKATVQAAIGGLPLAAGLACGKDVLSIAVLAILITAPLGAFLIDISYRKLLAEDKE